MELANNILEVLKASIINEKFFIAFSIIILSMSGVAIWFLVVMLLNNNIAYKRKDYGMNMVSQTIGNIKKLIMSNYYTLAKEKLGEDYFNCMETSIYRYVNVLGLEERRDRFRKRIRQNNFDKKSPEDWRKYVQEAVKEDLEAYTAYLDEHYHPHSVITRPELYQHNLPILPAIQRELEDLLQYLLKLACDNKFKKFFGKELHFISY